MSLRSILGRSSRVKKASSKSAGAKRASPGKRRSAPSQSAGGEEDEEDDFFDDKLDDCGLVKALAADMNLRDTAQAIQIAEVLNYRKTLPPIVTISHIQTLLSSPSAVEREIAQLAQSGFIRKIVVARRGDIGETLILSSDLDTLIDSASTMPATAKDNFKAYLKNTPNTQCVHRSALSEHDVDSLFRAGFLTAHHAGFVTHSSVSDTMNTFSRPEDRTSLVSLETVSRQPTGSLGTVGGAGAVYAAGGSGGRPGPVSLPANVTELRLAIPGNGAFLKLVSSALDHLVALLGKSRYREAPEGLLRDRWDGAVARDEVRRAAKRSRGEFAGILPGQTRKWKQFYGLSFDWVLQEAVGSGLVEVFETRSVGRGIRTL
ncbi:sulfate transporter family protein [Apiospora aurea]|uniref:Sulfate transporter family protein n=1 Tax=Apiospora aurea TaxID=335848 RepID=A0ABR1PWB9_9PEZI